MKKWYGFMLKKSIIGLIAASLLSGILLWKLEVNLKQSN
jgi:hypothetical protein